MKDYGLVQHTEESQEPTIALQPAPQTKGAFELDVQTTAAKRPRDLASVMKEAQILISDPDIAATMWYRLERKDRKTGQKVVIEGPSIRMAELMHYAWRNLAWGGNIIEVAHDRVIAEGLAVDLERNNPVRVTVSRSIMTKDGRRYSDEMIQLACGQAQAIAMRNALFKVIPGSFAKRVLLHAQKVAAGGETLAARREKALYWLRQHNVNEEEVLRLFSLSNIDQISEEDLARLRGFCQAIADGEQSTDDIFRRPFEEQAHEEAEALTSGVKASSPAKTTPAQPAKDDERGTAAAPPPLFAGEMPNGPEYPRALSEIFLQAESRHGKATWSLLKKHILAVTTDQDGMIDLTTLRAIVAVPKTILAAALKDSDILGTLRQIAAQATQTGK